MASSLLGGSKKSTSTSTTTRDIPSWLLPSLKDIAAQTAELGNKDYEAYTGQRIAGLSADEQSAYDLIRSLTGQSSGAFDGANATLAEVANRGLNGYSQATIDQYMNPYQTNVMDISRQRQLDQLDLQKRNLAQQQASIGSFGGSRSAIAQGSLLNNFDRQLAETEANQLYQGYNDAMNRAASGTQMAGQAAVNQAALAGQNQSLGLQQASALAGAGSAQRSLEQAGLDVDYQNFLTEKAYPYEQLQFQSSMLYPLADLVSGSTSTLTSKKSGGSGLLGTALGIGSMMTGIPGMGSFMGADIVTGKQIGRAHV